MTNQSYLNFEMPMYEIPEVSRSNKAVFISKGYVTIDLRLFNHRMPTYLPLLSSFFLQVVTSRPRFIKVWVLSYINKSVNGPTLQTMLYSVHTYEVIAWYKTIQNYSLNFILSVLEQTITRVFMCCLPQNVGKGLWLKCPL